MKDNGDIIEKLIDGCSLYTYMIPDDSMPTNRPLHSEGFYLPHIIITDDVFWAMGRTVHMFHTTEKYGSIHFCYTNHPGGIFFSYNPSMPAITFMSTKRYKRHVFIVKDNWKLIWDSAWSEKPQNQTIDHMIAKGSRFKIAMLDNENIWNIQPIDLPMSHIEEGTFSMKTEYFQYAFIIRSIQEINKMVETNTTFFNAKPESNQDGTLHGDCAPFHAFYNLFDNGEYYNFYDIPRGSRQRYKRLKIFCEKE